MQYYITFTGGKNAHEWESDTHFISLHLVTSNTGENTEVFSWSTGSSPEKWLLKNSGQQRPKMNVLDLRKAPFTQV